MYSVGQGLLSPPEMTYFKGGAGAAEAWRGVEDDAMLFDWSHEKNG